MKEINGLIGRREFVRRGALLLLPAAAAALPVVVPLIHAINCAGKIRGLSQRLSKAYVQGALNVLPDRAHDIQTATRQLLTSNLAEIATTTLSSDGRRLLQSLDKEVQSLLDMAATPKKDAKEAIDVARSADAVLETADRLTRTFESQSQQGNSRIVNIAGRQRMLSQRAARAYFLMAAGHDTPALRTQLANARNDFRDGLATLQGAAISTPSIRNELELARNQWTFYESALGKTSTPEALQTVATTSERVFEGMDNLTSLYDAALRDLIG